MISSIYTVSTYAAAPCRCWHIARPCTYSACQPACQLGSPEHSDRTGESLDTRSSSHSSGIWHSLCWSNTGSHRHWKRIDGLLYLFSQLEATETVTPSRLRVTGSTKSNHYQRIAAAKKRTNFIKTIIKFLLSWTFQKLILRSCYTTADVECKDECVWILKHEKEHFTLLNKVQFYWINFQFWISNYMHIILCHVSTLGPYPFIIDLKIISLVIRNHPHTALQQHLANPFYSRVPYNYT